MPLEVVEEVVKEVDKPSLKRFLNVVTLIFQPILSILSD